MVTMTTAPVPLNGDNSNPQGHCGRCGKIWVLNERQGVCPWCGKPASCITATSKPRRVKSRSYRKRKQDDHNGNGYEHLEGQWLTYYRVASRFAHKAKAEDKEDLLHDIIITLADVERNNGHKPFTEAVMYRIASLTVADYWRAYYKASNGLDCGSCSKAQREKCKDWYLYTDCPKAVRMESLDKLVEDGNGDTTPLHELIADDNTIDVVAMLDARFTLKGYPHKAVKLIYKRYAGYPLEKAEGNYLRRFLRRTQKSLIK